MNKIELRRQLRQKRRSLSATQQNHAALHLRRHFSHNIIFRKAKNIAFYLANDGEISPEYLMRFAIDHKKHCYLPVITDIDSMCFRRFISPGHLRYNRYNIQEPTPRCKTISSKLLDIVFMPLVGFDKKGNRLGMGGGFYDRTFAFKKRFPKSKPLLVGLAHSCQEVTALKIENWDISLDGIATENGFIFFNK